MPKNMSVTINNQYFAIRLIKNTIILQDISAIHTYSTVIVSSLHVCIYIYTISIPMQMFSSFIHWKTPHRTQLEYVSTTRKPYDIYHFIKEPQQSNIWINTIYVFPNSYCTFDQTDTMTSIPMQMFSNFIHWKTPHRTQLEYVSTTRKPYDIYHFIKEPQQSNIWINTIYVFPNSYCTFDQTDTMKSTKSMIFRDSSQQKSKYHWFLFNAGLMTFPYNIRSYIDFFMIVWIIMIFWDILSACHPSKNQ